MYCFHKRKLSTVNWKYPRHPAMQGRLICSQESVLPLLGFCCSWSWPLGPWMVSDSIMEGGTCEIWVETVGCRISIDKSVPQPHPWRGESSFKNLWGPKARAGCELHLFQIPSGDRCAWARAGGTTHSIRVQISSAYRVHGNLKFK